VRITRDPTARDHIARSPITRHHLSRYAGAAAIISAVALGGVACGVEGTAHAEGTARTEGTARVEGTARADGSRASTAVSTAAGRPTDAVDELVPIGETGARLHLRCSGSGASTVVLIAGLGDGGDSWGAVAPAVSERARVCSYARFGTGTSDAPPRVQTFTTQAADLHELLRVAGEPGPYVLVGHSFGGAEAVAFAARFTDEVAGLLLLDATPVGWPDAVCAVPDDGSEAAAGFRDTCAAISDPEKNPERVDATAAFAQVDSLGALGDRPLIVASRGDLSHPGLAAWIDAGLAREWTDGQAHWASLSSAAEVVTVRDTSHYIQLDQPRVVIDQILSLLPGAPTSRRP
jgi:pimeloyl-ACP methyl ester carboxylesterase